MNNWLGRLFGEKDPIGKLAAEARAADAGDVPETPLREQHETNEVVFFVTIFALLAKMAKADGVVSMEEIKAFDDYIANDLKCEAPTRRMAVQVFNEARDSHHSFAAIAKQFKKQFKHDIRMREEMLEVLYRMAMADGELHKNEAKLLRSAEKLFSVPAATCKHVRAFFVDGGDKQYAALRSKASEPVDEIEARYQKLRQQNDPESLVAAGLPRELVELAHRKVAELDSAIEAIKAQRA